MFAGWSIWPSHAANCPGVQTFQADGVQWQLPSRRTVDGCWRWRAHCSTVWYGTDKIGIEAVFSRTHCVWLYFIRQFFISYLLSLRIHLYMIGGRGNAFVMHVSPDARPCVTKSARCIKPLACTSHCNSCAFGYTAVILRWLFANSS